MALFVGQIVAVVTLDTPVLVLALFGGEGFVLCLVLAFAEAPVFFFLMAIRMAVVGVGSLSGLIGVGKGVSGGLVLAGRQEPRMAKLYSASLMMRPIVPGDGSLSRSLASFSRRARTSSFSAPTSSILYVLRFVKTDLIWLKTRSGIVAPKIG